MDARAAGPDARIGVGGGLWPDVGERCAAHRVCSYRAFGGADRKGAPSPFRRANAARVMVSRDLGPDVAGAVSARGRTLQQRRPKGKLGTLRWGARAQLGKMGLTL